MQSTVQLIKEVHAGKTDLGMRTGTGAVVENNEKGSLVLTAGHVARCFVSPEEMLFTPPADDAGGMLSCKTMVYDLKNVGCGADPVAIDVEHDLGLFQAHCHLGPAADVSREDPPTGGEVTSVGCPSSYHPDMSFFVGKGFALGADGDFHGQDAWSFAATFGSSGSPVFYQGRVVGVVSSITDGFEHLVYGAGVQRIQDFLRRARSQKP